MTPDAVPGNGTAISGEIDRLDDLKDRLWRAGSVLAALDVEDWRGAAADGYERCRAVFAARWTAAGDRHQDAARALERYQRTLAHVQALVRYTPDAAPGRLAEWRRQLAAEATASAAAVRAAAVELAALPDPLGTGAPAAAPPAAAVVRLPLLQRARLGASPQEHAVDPRTGSTDPAAYRGAVERLVADVLGSVFAPAG